MNTTTTRIALSLLSLGMFAALQASEPAKGKSLDDRKLQELARSAQTPDQHREVALQYELRARALETKATEHEKTADELTNRQGFNSMRHKWPAMVQAPIDQARSRAMQARRNAVESREMAAKHQDLAAKATRAAE